MKPSPIARLGIEILWDATPCACGREFPAQSSVFTVQNFGSSCVVIMCRDCFAPHAEAKRELARLPEPERMAEAHRLRTDAADKGARIDEILAASTGPWHPVEQVGMRDLDHAMGKLQKQSIGVEIPPDVLAPLSHAIKTCARIASSISDTIKVPEHLDTGIVLHPEWIEDDLLRAASHILESNPALTANDLLSVLKYVTSHPRGAVEIKDLAATMAKLQAQAPEPIE